VLNRAPRATEVVANGVGKPRVTDEVHAATRAETPRQGAVTFKDVDGRSSLLRVSNEGR
jgi:hypothetical protein